MPITPDEIRRVELPRAFRGFEEAATERLLEEAAVALASALAERNSMLRERETPDQSELNPAEQLGEVLLTANRLAERLLAEAREDAGRLTAQAQLEATELRTRAETEVQAVQVEVERRCHALVRQEESLRTLIAQRRQDLAVFMRAAVSQLAEGPDADLSANDYNRLQSALSERLNIATSNGVGGEPTPADDL